MNKILKVRNVGDYSRWVGHTDRHPLVSVIDYAEVSPVRHSLNNYSIYGIFFHDEAEIDLAYGCGKYDVSVSAILPMNPKNKRLVSFALLISLFPYVGKQFPVFF